MTQKVHLSFDRRIRNREVSAAIQYGGGSDGWISEAGTRLVEDSEGDLPTGDLGTFDYTNSSGLTVTIGAGEALVEGGYIATDETFGVDLAVSTDNQTVYVGWQDGLPDTIIVGLDGAFSADDHQIAAWEFDTDSSSVTASQDVRTLGQAIAVKTLDTNSFGGDATESIQDIVGGLVVGKNDATVTYDDPNDELAVDVSTLTNEQVEDIVASLVASDSNLSWSYDDPNNTLTVSLADSISTTDIEATNKITDPSGVDHTGELADSSDIPSLVGKIYYQKTEPSETPSPPPGGGGGVWYPKTELSGGSEQWSYSVGSRVSSGVAIANDTAVFGNDGTGTVYGIDITDGSQQWTFSAGGDVKSGVDIANGTAVIGSNDNNVYGLDISDGTQQWSFSTGGSVQSGIAIDSGTAVAGSDDNNVYGLDITDGTQQWSYSTGDIVRSGIAIANGTAVVGSYDTNLYGLDITDGSQQFSFSTPSSMLSGVAIANGTAVFGNNNFGATNVYAVDISNGTQQWNFAAGGVVESGVDIANGTVVIGSSSDTVYGLDLTDGTQEWSFSTGSDVKFDVEIANGIAVTGSNDRNVYAIDITDGSEVWSFKTNDQVKPGGVAIDGNTVAVGSADYNLYGLRLEKVGRYETPKVSDGSKWIDKL